MYISIIINYDKLDNKRTKIHANRNEYKKNYIHKHIFYSTM